MTFRHFAFSHVLRNKRTYAAYYLSSSFSVMVFFLCALFLFHPGIQENMIYDQAVQALQVAEGTVYFFSFFFVIYSVASFLQSRKREFGILRLHGMTVKQLNRMLFLENVTIGGASIITGIAAGLVSAKLFLMAGANMLGIERLSFHISWAALLLTLMSFAALFLLISLYTPALIGKSKLMTLFQSNQRVVEPPRKSPVRSGVGAGLVILSYYLAATSTAANVVMRMIPVTLMTVVGTYLVYAHFGAYFLALVRRRPRLFWRKTNIVTVPALAQRMSRNAQMLFLVTIISTITFCAIGVFASIHRLSDEFRQDYLAGIGYVSKAANLLERDHLLEIESELTARGITYERVSLSIRIVDVVQASRSAPAAMRMALVSYSDYARLIAAAGIPFEEVPLSGQDALIMLGSQRERPLLKERPLASYTIPGTGLKIVERGITNHVPIPEYLMLELGGRMEGKFSGLVVSDEWMDRLPASAQEERYFGFYFQDPTQGEEIGNALTRRGKMAYEEEQPYAMTVSGTLFAVQKSIYSTMLFIALLVGTVFFIASGSFLYFRLYADLDYDRRQYTTMVKIGVTKKEIDTMITRQIGLLFFVPIVLAIIHSFFAFVALQSYLNFSIAMEAGFILMSFFVIQIMYFFFIRRRYLRNLRKALG
ncbi:ABC transporter permease [Paenibacillus woosongensis]|uniref:ABC transporter permease n=1 Tax=Paenibacillus woosongensis TaxID=307580 RepID=A0AA95KUE4_9BACL|nr:ABC transporter permease [Paenibacillus woosongensis]WHX47320.1 ABC transporter permease [Paenibacillus woosongensis]